MLIIRNAFILQVREGREDTSVYPYRKENKGGIGEARESVEPDICYRIVIDQGKIVSLDEDDQSAPIGAQEIDAKGLIVTPGWIDIQLNGGFGYDFTEQPTRIWEVASRLPALGLTAFLPTIISCPLEKVERALAVLREGPPAGWKGAVPLGLHLEGPFLNPAKRGAHNPAYLRIPDPSLIRTWTRESGVSLVTLAPELPGAPETIRILRENGVVVSAGHTMADFDQTLQAFEAGVTCVTHLFNAQPPLNHRQPGLVGAALDTASIFTGIIADGIHVHPAAVSMAWKCKGEGLILVTDAVSALGMPEGLYTIGDYEVIVDKTGVHLSDGTLAGSNATPERCIRNLFDWTDCSIMQAAAAMSIAPAELLGLHRRRSISPGSDADLTLMTSNGQVAAAIVGGELLFSQHSNG